MAISDVLAKIKSQAQALNSKTDELTATIERIEHELRGSGVEFWWHGGHLLGERTYRDEDQTIREAYMLGYTKIGDEWVVAVQLCVGALQEDEYTGEAWHEVRDGEPVALKRSARRLRVEAAESLEPFLDALSVAIAEMTARVDKANAVAKDEPAAIASDPDGAIARANFERAMMDPGGEIGGANFERAFQKAMAAPAKPAKPSRSSPKR